MRLVSSSNRSKTSPSTQTQKATPPTFLKTLATSSDHSNTCDSSPPRCHLLPSDLDPILVFKIRVTEAAPPPAPDLDNSSLSLLIQPIYNQI
uniref:Uncharacterized protein n=1 Tax=Kalanchoe fedtschenkoi TaxID=63787 RepID=A0A7N0T465_KALFE